MVWVNNSSKATYLVSWLTIFLGSQDAFCAVDKLLYKKGISIYKIFCFLPNHVNLLDLGNLSPTFFLEIYCILNLGDNSGI